MRIYHSQIPRIAADIIQTLRKDNDIDVEDGNLAEAERDVAVIMEQYLKTEQDLVEQAKDLVELRGGTGADLGRIKRELSERHQIPLGDEGIRWVVGQIIECFMISKYIDEVYTDDHVLRKKVQKLVERNLVDEAALEKEVRDRLKNLQEGTSAWDIQYRKTMREIRRKHGLA